MSDYTYEGFGESATGSYYMMNAAGSVDISSGVFDRFTTKSRNEAVHSVKIYNLCNKESNKTLFIRRPEGTVKAVKKTDIRRSNLMYGKSAEDTEAMIESVSLEGGLLVHIVGSGNSIERAVPETIPAIKMIPYAQFKEGTQEVRNLIDGDSTYNFCLFVPESDIDKFKNGLLVAQAGFTVGNHKHIHDKTLAFTGHPDAMMKNAAGIRYQVVTSKSRYQELHMVLDNQVFTVHTEDEDIDRVNDRVIVYYTGPDCQETIKAVVPLHEAIEGKLVKLPGYELNLKIYTNYQDAYNASKYTEVVSRHNDELREKVARMEKEHPEALRALKAKLQAEHKEKMDSFTMQQRNKEEQNKQSFWNRTLSWLSSIFSPVVKLCSILLAFII